MTIPTLDARQFMVGKYEIRATPMTNAAHMLRYTIYVDGKRIGAMASVPCESDCRYIEHPPQDPLPLVPTFQYAFRPPRPKKNAPSNSTFGVPSASHNDLPYRRALPRPTDER